MPNTNPCGWNSHVNEKGEHIRGGKCSRCNRTICWTCEGTGTEYTGAAWAMEPGPCTRCKDGYLDGD